MAYSPFRSFHKHQKTYFAALTILCMFVFVLGGISGNLDELKQYFGPSRGQVAATIDGKKVTLPQINEVRIMREMANQFVRTAQELISVQLAGQITSQLNRTDLKLDSSSREAS